MYRSIMVMRGETRPEAQAAAVKSEKMRHDRLLVFHSRDLRESIVFGAWDGRGIMMFGEAGFSPMDPARPL